MLNSAKRVVPSGGIRLMAPKPKLFYSDTTKANLVTFAHIGHVSCLSSMVCVEYCETDFRLNEDKLVNRPAAAAVLWK